MFSSNKKALKRLKKRQKAISSNNLPHSNGSCFQGLKCDKLLLNMLEKKRKRKKLNEEEEASLLSSNDDGVPETAEAVNGGSSSSSSPPRLPPKVKKKKGKKKKASLSPEVDNDDVDDAKPVTQNDSEASRRSGPDLPITECRETFIQNFLDNDVLLVVGETGSGKSTQIPQYLIQDCPHFFSYRGMGITQPRRVAAMSLARRVAFELGTNVGELVGYKVRFEKETSPKTKITFLTDGFLMMEAIRDNLFREYSVIIVDEAHERSVETDVVLSLLRNAQIQRKKANPKKRLKLIVMSATLDIDKFKTFFHLEEYDLKTKAVYIRGRPYKVEIKHLPVSGGLSENHVDLVWITLLKLHMQLPVEDHILVFLTGKEEIDLVVSRALSINQQKSLAPVLVCPMYAALPKEVQLKSFILPQEGTRKIVVSTNLAETSLTIPGIRVVIDSGRVKSKYFEESLGMDVLRVQLVSKSQANQRAGRAGREDEGAVYRLYTKQDFESMEEFPSPEISRSNLSRIILLTAVSLGVEDFTKFPLPDKPTQRAIKYAMSELHLFGAIESPQLPLKLTRISKKLLSFPLELHLSRVLYLAVQYQELSRICAIVAMLTVESVYVNQTLLLGGEEGYHHQSRHSKYQTLWTPEGDFLTFWKIFKEYKKSRNKKAWCREFGVQYRTMQYVVQVWRHLLTLCQAMTEEMEEDEKLSAGDAVQFSDKCCLIFKTAFAHQGARLSAKGNVYIVESPHDSSLKFHAKIHPSSSLVQRKPARLIFSHLSFNETSNAVFMHNCGVI